MPLGGPSVVPDTIADIEALGLAEADREKIFEGNARRLLRLESAAATRQPPDREFGDLVS